VLLGHSQVPHLHPCYWYSSFSLFGLYISDILNLPLNFCPLSSTEQFQLIHPRETTFGQRVTYFRELHRSCDNEAERSGIVDATYTTLSIAINQLVWCVAKRMSTSEEESMVTAIDPSASLVRKRMSTSDGLRFARRCGRGNGRCRIPKRSFSFLGSFSGGSYRQVILEI